MCLGVCMLISVCVHRYVCVLCVLTYLCAHVCLYEFLHEHVCRHPCMRLCFYLVQSTLHNCALWPCFYSKALRLEYGEDEFWVWGWFSYLLVVFCLKVRS